MEARKKLKTLSVAAENTAIGEDIVDVGVSFVGLQLTFGNVLALLTRITTKIKG